MSEKRPLCRFCGQRHFGYCETDRTAAKSFITEYLADRPHRTAAVIEADNDEQPVSHKRDKPVAEPFQSSTDTVPIVNASTPDSVPIVNARSDCQRAEDGWLIPCECGCGEMVKVKPQYVSKAHRQRAYRNRQK